MRVADILRKKGHEVVTLSSAATVAQLLETLDDHKIGAVIVLDDNRVVGVVSERDVIHHLRAGGDQTSAVSVLMTADVQTVSTRDDLDHLAITMTERRLRHLPVVEDDALQGIISIGDVVKARLDSLSAERDHLEDYLRKAP